MSIVSELMEIPGVISAGEYSYRGDRFSYKGHMTEEDARKASIMCRATTMSVRMQTDILSSFCPQCGLSPSKGWVVKGPHFTVCTVANIFCFLDESKASLNAVLSLMRERLKDASGDLV